MSEGMAPIVLKWLQRESTVSGVFYYVRKERGGPRVRIKGEPGTPEFLAAYHAAIGSQPDLKPTRPTLTPQTLEWLARAYMASAAYAALAPATQATRRNILTKVCTESGTARLADIDRAAIVAGRERRAHQPEAANGFVKVLRALFAWGVEFDYLESNPCDKVKKVSSRTDGFHTWTRAEIETFRAAHAIGTKPRLALEIALHTGLRRSDIVRLSPSHVRDGCVEIRPTKTPNIVVSLPLLGPLATALDATPRTGLTYLETLSGKPFTAAGFTNWFRGACREAGVPGSAHGLRKAAASMMAEAGATDRQLMAVFGWTSAAMASLYTKAADRRRMGREAGTMLEQPVPKAVPKRP